MSFSDILSAVFTAGIPLFLLTFVLVALALHRGVFAGSNVKEVQESMASFGKAHKKDRKGADPVLGKWLRFGGGFYGLVALYTWLLIEWDEVVGFLAGLPSLIINLEIGAIISLVINLIVESFMNFVLAIAWPAYWLGDSRDAWLLLPVAYGGYWLGIKAAQHAWQQGWVTQAVDQVAARLRRQRDSE